MDPFILTLFQFAVLIFSVIVHEISHGFMALRLGDETAKNAGRLTLNPVSHIDPIGSILLPLSMYFLHAPMIGWAKPVPYNPLNLYKDPKYGPLKVALAGPFSNLALAVIFGLFLRFAGLLIPETAAELVALIVLINCVLFVFNLIPIPPFDGSKILTTFLPFEYAIKLERLGFNGLLIILLALSFFPGFVDGLARGLFSIIVGA